MVELADTPGLGPGAERLAGSMPVGGTNALMVKLVDTQDLKSCPYRVTVRVCLGVHLEGGTHGG